MDLKDLKKLARTLKLPGSSEFFENSITWRKSGGHAGDNAISKVLEAARQAGFLPQKSTHSGNPDGSRVGSGTTYVKDNVTLAVGSSYGVTKSDNRFYIRVTVTEAPTT